MDLKKSYLITDIETGLSVTIMPKYDMCLDLIKALPSDRNYRITEFSLVTKLLHPEFAGEIGPVSVMSYYAKVDAPLKPEDWYGSENID